MGLLGAILAPGPALAYVGPGAGLSVLGALWGVLAAIAVAMGFVVAWPVRRLLRRRRERMNRVGDSNRDKAGAGPSR